MTEGEDQGYIGIFHQDPGGDIRHPVNLLRRMGMQMMRYRRRINNGDGQSAAAFGADLSKYTGKQVDRNRLARAESADTAVRFEVYAAYFLEMGVMNELVDSMMRVNNKDVRLMIDYDADVPGQLKQLISASKNEGDNNAGE